MPISSTTTIHDVKFLRATSTRTMGAPLTLYLEDDTEQSCSVILFVGNQKLADALVEAINAVCQGHSAAVAELLGLPDNVA